MNFTTNDLEKIYSYIKYKSKVKYTIVTYTKHLTLDVQNGDDFICRSIEGDCNLNIVNANDGDDGVIELKIDDRGGYTFTLGPMFTKRMSPGILSSAPGADNFLFWRKVYNDILYWIETVIE